MGVDVSAYDEYFDGLTGAERNRELQLDARHRRIEPTQATEEVVERHWFIRSIGYVLVVVGATLDVVGQVAMYTGRGIQSLGRSFAGLS